MSKTVVAIEDDPQIAELIKLMLAAEDVIVHHYADGAEGLAGVIEHKPNLVLLDIMIPGMTGWEVHEKIRTHEEIKDTPVMILSVTQQTIEQKLTFKQSKVDFYMNKPFEILALREKINQILQVDRWQVDGTLPDTVPAARTQIKPIRDLLLAAQKVEEEKRKQREVDATATPVPSGGASEELPRTALLRPLPSTNPLRAALKGALAEAAQASAAAASQASHPKEEAPKPASDAAAPATNSPETPKT